MSAVQYRPEIDGLRALAVVPVILFHAGFAVFSGGYVGVDIFFVISGYLITSIIVNELNEGNFSIVTFYERRARRILPALFLVMFLSIPFALFWMLPSEIADFSQSLVAVSLFGSNFLFWRQDNYFAAAAEEKPLLHTWSLAVEEQYYVLFPLFLLLFWRFGRKPVFVVIVAVAIGSSLLAEWGWRNVPSANFYLAPTRVWEILIGSICAMAQPGRTGQHSNLLSGLGLALVGVSIFAFDADTPFPSFYALLPTIGTALVILYGTSGTSVATLLSGRPLVGIGLISYSAYLWHQPLFAFARIRSLYPPPQWIMLFLAASSIVLAYLSWRFVETPLRNKRMFGRRFIFSLSAIGISLFVAVGLVGSKTDGFESQWLALQSKTVSHAYTLIDGDSGADPVQSILTGPPRAQTCRFNTSKLSATVQQRLEDCFAKHGKGYLIFGDSHAIDLYQLVEFSSTEKFIFGFTKAGCRPHTPEPSCEYDAFINFVKSNSRMFAIGIYEQAGFYLLRNSREKGSRAMLSSVPMTKTIEGVVPDTEHIGAVLAYLSKVSVHVPLVWFGPRLEPHIPDKLILRQGCNYKFALRKNQSETFEDLDSYLNKSVTSVPGLQFLSQNDSFKFAFPDDFMNCREIYWRDGDHFSTAGKKRFGARFDIIRSVQ
jgi:peptidoglycan/LPS O-acetylase OafA/YrhL